MKLCPHCNGDGAARYIQGRSCGVCRGHGKIPDRAEQQQKTRRTIRELNRQPKPRRKR